MESPGTSSFSSHKGWMFFPLFLARHVHKGINYISKGGGGVLVFFCRNGLSSSLGLVFGDFHTCIARQHLFVEARDLTSRGRTDHDNNNNNNHGVSLLCCFYF